MPTIIALLSLLTPTLLLASPTPVTTPSNRLMIRNNLLTCAIVNVSTYVNCREDPNSSSASKGKYKDGSKHNFGCYAIGQCVDGNWYVWSPIHCRMPVFVMH